MKIYCLSGLGTDRKAFRNLHLKNHDLLYLDWVEPLVFETLDSYASRIKALINTKEDFALIGLSFGGMVAVEIAKLIKPLKLILISSIVNEKEFPGFFKLGSIPGINKIAMSLLTQSGFLLNHYFGTTTRTDKRLLKEMLDDMDEEYLKWAVYAITRWKNMQLVDCVRIHGTNDRIFPADKLNIDYKIIGGGHFMIINRADEINNIIEKEMAKVQR